MPTETAINTFVPEAWQIAPWRDKSRILLLTGSAGGGKSTLMYEKLHAFCLKYPNSTCLICRKTLVSMTNSTIPVLEKYIIGINQTNLVHHAQTKKRFEYHNGSMLMYGGMADEKQRTAIRSIGQKGGLDMWGMEEGTEFDEADFDELLPRLRGKAVENYWIGRLTQEWMDLYQTDAIPPQWRHRIRAEASARSWHQGMIATNPDSPLHWIHTRLIQGKGAKVYYSSALDNSHNPDDYQETLGMLTGTQKQRLADGLWVKAEGIIYAEWLDDYDQVRPPKGNVTTDAAFIPGAGPVYWAIDDGYSVGSRKDTLRGMDPKTRTYVADSHPRAILLFQLKPDGHIDLFAEDYACLELPDPQLDRVEALGYPDPEWAVFGPGAATLRGHVFDRGHYVKTCKADVKDSIKLLREFVAPDQQGWRRLRVHPDCRQFRAEMASYAYDADGETPTKAFDHGPDAARYLAVKLSREL